METIEPWDSLNFLDIRARIHTSACPRTAFQRELKHYMDRLRTDGTPAESIAEGRDAFLTGLLLPAPIPEVPRPDNPEMVAYHPTPIGTVCDLVARLKLQPEDVLYDIGSGLGHVPILVHVLTGVQALGVEIEPVYHAYAIECAKVFNLTSVQFWRSDARQADYSRGTIFFLYTPFTGHILADVLDKVRRDTAPRPIRLATLGPCTLQVEQISWLTLVEPYGDDLYQAAIFCSGGVS